MWILEVGIPARSVVSANNADVSIMDGMSRSTAAAKLLNS